MKKRQSELEEKLCKDIFVKICKNNKIIPNNWSNQSIQKKDPPDYYVEILNKKYAIEVTGMGVKKNSLNRREFIKISQKFSKEIMDKTLKKNILNGAYFIHFYEPFKIKKFKKELEEKITIILKDTKCHDNFQNKEIKIDNNPICNIGKINNKTNCIESIYTEFGWTYSDENIEKTISFVQERIDAKTHTLRDIQVPKILLILDTWLLSDSKVYNLISSKLNYNDFDTIIIIRDSSSSSILYSKLFDVKFLK